MKNRDFFVLTGITLIGVMLLLLPACKLKPAALPEESVQATTPESAVKKEYDRDAVKFTVKADKTDITIAEKINLVLEVTAHKDYTVTFPELLGQMDPFGIKDSQVLPSRILDNGDILMVQTYVLEPFLSGEYKIPSLTFRYWAKEDTKDNAHLLATDEIPVKVKSLLPEDLEKLTLKDIMGPVAPPAPDLTWVIITGIALVIVLAGGIFVIIRIIKSREKKLAVAFIPAHELAFRQLRALVKQNYIDTGEYKLFYGGISNILRHYIENRFGLQAPERTTEEFLFDIKDNAAFTTEQHRILKEFLKHCDLVKFAELMPATEQVQQTFDLCKNFILETQDQAARIEDTGDHNPYLAAQAAAGAENTPIPQQADAAENPEKQDINHD